jgi:glutamate-ammonia-ligase adenylyltransferase
MSEPAAGRRTVFRLARLGFRDGDGAAELLTAEPLRWWDADRNEPTDDAAAAILTAIGESADPDAALDFLARLLVTPAAPRLRRALTDDARYRSRLVALLGASVALAEHLVEYPDDWQVLYGDRAPSTLHADVDPDAGEVAVAELRHAYRRELVALAGRDLAGELSLREVTEALSDLAADTLRVALSIATARLPAPAEDALLAIVAMGKTGARELNYLSDVDVVFVGEPEAGLADVTALARETMRICRAVAWQVDAALRPEGKDGPLVRTLASHEAYYRRWASTWEFQALLKARPVAGDAELGRHYLDTIAPFVWTAAERENFVADVRAMRRRVLDHVPATIAQREIKLGPGGLRDVEFAVQLLQLVHGRGDETLRVAATLPALEALRDGGYVGREDAQRLIEAYTFLRATEHRLQLRKLHRTHLVPDEPDELEWLGRALGLLPQPGASARERFEQQWAVHAREVRRLHEKLFYRPLLEAVARVPSEGLRLTPAEAGRRLAALGFADPAGALRHIESLTAGLSRRAALQRALLPAMLSDFADAPDPDGGLLAYRQLSDQLGSTSWYLRLLRDEGAVASRLAFLLGTSRYVARMLGRAPEALAMLADDAELRPREPGELLAAMRDSAARQDDPAVAVAVIRGLRRQELLRTAFADLLGLLDVGGVCRAISEITRATLRAALEVAERAVAAERGIEALPVRFAVIAMGRLGGDEVGYGSDADVMFVYEAAGFDAAAEQTAAGVAQDVAARLRALLATPSASDPPLGIDADLRPEGRNGPLVRSLASYLGYYARWSSAWEAQALLRAGYAAGDEDLAARFLDAIAPVRYPRDGISSAELVEIRRLKARMDAERLPRGADPSTHTKLGRGGLADVEWTVQLLQLRHAGAIPALRTPRTLEALGAAVAAGLLGAEQGEALAAAWRSATRTRNAIMLVRDRAEDQLPHQGSALVAVGRALGYPQGLDPGQVIDDYRRTARRARHVVEEIFYPGARQG